jgi:hypothetical protein
VVRSSAQRARSPAEIRITSLASGQVRLHHGGQSTPALFQNASGNVSGLYQVGLGCERIGEELILGQTAECLEVAAFSVLAFFP